MVAHHLTNTPYSNPPHTPTPVASVIWLEYCLNSNTTLRCIWMQPECLQLKCLLTYSSSERRNTSSHVDKKEISQRMKGKQKYLSQRPGNEKYHSQSQRKEKYLSPSQGKVKNLSPRQGREKVLSPSHKRSST